MFGRTSIRFLVSNALSLLGNSIAAVALPLILLATTGDALAAGTLALICAVPQVAIGIVGGAALDRFNPPHHYPSPPTSYPPPASRSFPLSI